MQKNGEKGRIGQKRYGGIFYEEFVPQLQGNRGIEVYREMSENDDVIGAVLFAVEMLIRQCEFSVEPANSKNKIDVEAAEFIETCMHDMEQTWQDTLSEILSFLIFGWSYHEIVYKRRMGGKFSKYNDGLIGWKKLPIRAQETLFEWAYKENTDDLEGMVQVAPPSYDKCMIPIEKAMHFRTKSRKNSPEGRSVLRNAYRSWYFKKRMQEIEGIGVERDLAGYPMLKPPEDMDDIWNPDKPEMVALLNTAETFVKNVRRDEMEGAVLPHGWEFTLLSSGGRRNFDVGSIIDRYDKRMAMTVLADFIFLGQGQTGSFALSADKTRLFSLSIGTYLDIICNVFNEQGIRRLIDLNGDKFQGMTDYPKMVHGDVEDANLSKFGEFIANMVGKGVIVPDEELEKYARNLANIPQADGFEYRETDASQVEPDNENQWKHKDIEIDDSIENVEEALITEEAKKSLGRGRR